MASLEEKIIDELKLALEYQSTRGRFYCALCWQKNTEQSVWKSFAGGCDFQLLSVSNRKRSITRCLTSQINP